MVSNGGTSLKNNLRCLSLILEGGGGRGVEGCARRVPEMKTMRRKIAVGGGTLNDMVGSIYRRTESKY